MKIPFIVSCFHLLLICALLLLHPKVIEKKQVPLQITTYGQRGKDETLTLLEEVYALEEETIPEPPASSCLNEEIEEQAMEEKETIQEKEEVVENELPIPPEAAPEIQQEPPVPALEPVKEKPKESRSPPKKPPEPVKEKPKEAKKTVQKTPSKAVNKPSTAKSPVKPIAKASAPKVKTPQKAKAEPKKMTASPSKKSGASSSQKADPNHDKLIALMEKSLSSLNGQGEAKKGGAAAVTKSVGKLGSETLSTKCDIPISRYEDELVIYLKHTLSLPEYGDVRIRLTLSSDGRVSALQVLSSISAVNQKLIEKKVPTLRFPSFDERFKGEKSHSFTITLKSD